MGAIYDDKALPGDLITYDGTPHIVLCRLNERQVSIDKWDPAKMAPIVSRINESIARIEVA